MTARPSIPRVIVRHNLPESPHLLQEVNILANLTELLDHSLLDFTSGSFIGRSVRSLHRQEDLPLFNTRFSSLLPWTSWMTSFLTLRFHTVPQHMESIWMHIYMRYIGVLLQTSFWNTPLHVHALEDCWNMSVSSINGCRRSFRVNMLLKVSWGGQTSGGGKTVFVIPLPPSRMRCKRSRLDWKSRLTTLTG